MVLFQYLLKSPGLAGEGKRVPGWMHLSSLVWKRIILGEMIPFTSYKVIHTLNKEASFLCRRRKKAKGVSDKEQRAWEEVPEMQGETEDESESSHFLCFIHY